MNQPSLMVVNSRRIHYVGRLGQDEPGEPLDQPVPRSAWIKPEVMKPNVLLERPMITKVEGIAIIGGTLALIAGLLTGDTKGGILAVAGLTSLTVATVSAALVRPIEGY